jgi:acyl-CoA thioesterase FadM
MIHYWYMIAKIMVLRKIQQPVAFDATLERSYRVRLFDCDGLRVMTASRYPAYMDFIRWELIARSPLFGAIVKRGLAPTLGSQKLIYRRPLKRWTRFKLRLEMVGWDDKWVYHLHHFTQEGRIHAIGVTRALIWKRDVPSLLADVIREAGGPSSAKAPPGWVNDLFVNDTTLLEMGERELFP